MLITLNPGAIIERAILVSVLSLAVTLAECHLTDVSGPGRYTVNGPGVGNVAVVLTVL